MIKIRSHKNFLAMLLCFSIVLTGFVGSASAQRRYRHHSRKKGALIGGAAGAVGGALIGGRKGALIGAGAGAGTGYLVQRHRNRKARRRARRY